MRKTSDAMLISRKYGMTTHLPDSLVECISNDETDHGLTGLVELCYPDSDPEIKATIARHWGKKGCMDGHIAYLSNLVGEGCEVKTARHYADGPLTYLRRLGASAIPLSTLDIPMPPRRTGVKPSAGHVTCEHCSGMGFMRSGEFGVDRRFVKCEWCKGLGQKYLEV